MLASWPEVLVIFGIQWSTAPLRRDDSFVLKHAQLPYVNKAVLQYGLHPANRDLGHSAIDVYFQEKVLKILCAFFPVINVFLKSRY